MPFTPFHMGPGLLIKAVLQGSFSLMVFGWAQIIMDLQPLIVLITGEGRLHGFTHTYVGATLIGVFSGLTGKYLSEWALHLLRGMRDNPVFIGWPIAMVSAFIGSYSHVIIDSVMHADMEPLYPFSIANAMLGVMSVEAVYRMCVYTGLAGTVLYFTIHWLLTKYRRDAATGEREGR